jgi:hypothetical protein
MSNFYDVHWYGPHSLDNVEVLDDRNLVLYMLCGTHGMYGKNVPLYIGKTLRTVSARMKEHSWIDAEPDPVQVYAAAVSKKFACWQEIQNDIEYPPPENLIVERLESLLIYAHQPVYNIRSKGYAGVVEEDFVVFNTGRRSILLPEVSTMYWYR